MTLARLIEAVTNGTDPGDAVLALPDQQTTDFFYAANRGSLDAAKRLHDALLPGWEWLVRSRGDYACVWEPEEMGDKDAEAVSADNPARAWLLAILRAMEGR